MRKKIILKRLYHRDKWRLVFVFDWDESLVAIIRTINGNRYSNTNKCWYADDNEETLKQILRAFRDKADIDISSLTRKPDSEVSSLPENKKEISIPDPKVNADSLKHEKDGIETEILPAHRTIEKIVDRSGFGSVEFRINDKDGRLSVKFTGRYEQEWIDEISSYGKYYYDKLHREFLLPWTQIKVDSLSDYFAFKGVDVRVIKQTIPGELKVWRGDFGNEVRSRQNNGKALEGLDKLQKYLEDNRYSDRTIEVYLSLLGLFFKYYNEKDPMDITHNDVSEFVNSYIIKLGFSKSYQNQMISAIKVFYEISGRGKIIPQILERPKRSRPLPKVFSKDEVTRILSSTRNDKHKLLLWMIYSCGLRRSEVTNIRLTDLDRDRGILHIREGKGRVDRIVPVSDKVWGKLDEYISGFQPVEYLFEGQGGGRYSVESVYNVFKQALHKAGIKKEVGVHSLRHSYATHLHESGLDIRYIQELLGHRSSRTTEIYTHVSRRNLIAVRSPIEDLEVG